MDNLFSYFRRKPSSSPQSVPESLNCNNNNVAPTSSPTSSPPSSPTSSVLDPRVSQLVSDKEEQEINETAVANAHQERALDLEMKKLALFEEQRKRLEVKKKAIKDQFILLGRCPEEIIRSKDFNDEIKICGNEAKLRSVYGEQRKRVLCEAHVKIIRRRRVKEEELEAESKPSLKRKQLNDNTSSEEEDEEEKEEEENPKKQAKTSEALDTYKPRRYRKFKPKVPSGEVSASALSGGLNYYDLV